MSLDPKVYEAVMQTRAELGVRRAADGIGADARLVLDSRAVQAAVDSIDVGAVSDYDAAVGAAVKSVVDGNPARFGMPAPQAPAAPSGPPQWTLDDVKRASPSEIDTALRAGSLIDLGCPPPRKRR